MAVIILYTNSGAITTTISGSWDVVVEAFKSNCRRLSPGWGKLIENDGEIMAEYVRGKFKEL